MPASSSVVKSNNMAVKKSAPASSSAPATPAVAAAPAPKTAARKTPAKTAVTVPVTSDVVVTAPEVVVPRSSAVVLAELQDHLKALSADVTTRVRALVSEALEAAKSLKRDVRDSKKRRRKDPADMTAEEKAVWESRRANNAFLKMRPLSDELCSFMGLAAKSQRSQTDVTKHVATYVREHSCFDPTFKRRIIPDAKLGKLLRVKDGQEVTYLNLQSFLKVHFLKPPTPTA
jgi:chromatin remodeling complex protein RSC6